MHYEAESLQKIKEYLKLGIYDYDTAKMLAKPYLKALNEKMAKVAAKHKQKHYPVGFNQFMR